MGSRIVCYALAFGVLRRPENDCTFCLASRSPLQSNSFYNPSKREKRLSNNCDKYFVFLVSGPEVAGSGSNPRGNQHRDNMIFSVILAVCAINNMSCAMPRFVFVYIFRFRGQAQTRQRMHTIPPTITFPLQQFSNENRPSIYHDSQQPLDRASCANALMSSLRISRRNTEAPSPSTP